MKSKSTIKDFRIFSMTLYRDEKILDKSNRESKH